MAFVRCAAVPSRQATSRRTRWQTGKHGLFENTVLDTLTHTGAILITGPANAKAELKNYMAEHRPDLAKCISGVETLDHPSDGALVALASNFFKADDRMHSQPL